MSTNRKNSIRTGDRVSPVIPGLKAWTKCDAFDHRCTGEIRTVPRDAFGTVIKIDRARALVRWGIAPHGDHYGWTEREFLTHEAPQAEMPIDGGFALVAETAIDTARIAREKAAEAEREEQARQAQMSLF